MNVEQSSQFTTPSSLPLSSSSRVEFNSYYFALSGNLISIQKIQCVVGYTFIVAIIRIKRRRRKKIKIYFIFKLDSMFNVNVNKC